MRLLKPAQNNVGLRASILKSLGCAFQVIGKSADEAVTRDVGKHVRPMAAGDKALLVQRHACWCLEQLHQHTTYFDNTNDFEKLQQNIWKAMDSHSPTVRRAAASCLSSIYIKSYAASPQGTKVSQPKKKPKQKIPNGNQADPEMDRPQSPATTKSSVALSLGMSDIMRALFSHYSRPSASNRTRAAIALTCVRMFKGLDDGLVEEQYERIALLFFNELLDLPYVFHNRYRLLITRKFVRIILSDVIGCRILGESAQIASAKFLVNGILKDYPQSDVKERPEPSKEAIVGALDALRSLIISLGSAANNIAELCRGGIFQVLEHPSFTVQIHASRCLRALVLACPQQLLPSATLCLNSLTREVGQLSSARRSHRLLGHLAHSLCTAPQRSILEF